jgi:hypothetical protein
MPCLRCKCAFIKHQEYQGFLFCPANLNMPMYATSVYKSMTNLEYLEYQYEKIQTRS